MMLIFPVVAILIFAALCVICSAVGGTIIGAIENIPPYEPPDVKAAREEREHQEWRKRVNQPDVSPFGD